MAGTSTNGFLAAREPFPGLVDQYGDPYQRQERERVRQSEYGPFAVPPVLTFATAMGAAYRVFWHGRHDEAMKAGREEALAMKRDAFLMALMQERKLGTTSLKWRIKVDNPLDPYQKAVKESITRLVRTTKRLQALRYYLLEGIWYGRYGSQMVWEFQERKLPQPGMPDREVAQKVLVCKAHTPVNGDKIDFRWDGTAYVQVHGSQGFGENSGIPNARTILTNVGRALVLDTPNWRQRFIIHKHEVMDADFFDYQAASAMHGVGVRSTLYWLNWLRNEWIANVADWCERTGLGVRLWYYQGGNAKSKEEVGDAAKAQSVNKVNILVPRFGDNPMEGVEFVETVGTGAELLQKLWEHIENHIERYVIGQTLSSDTEGSGLGGTGVAGMHAACVPVEGTEILTRRGFKSASEVAIGEEVLAYDVETDRCRWTPLLNKTFYKDAPVQRLSVSRNHFESVCTPDHSWATEKRGTSMSGREWYPSAATATVGLRGGRTIPGRRKLTKAFEIVGHDKLILSAPECETVESLLTPDEAAFLGWAVTDGTIKVTHRMGVRKNSTYIRVGICQSKPQFIPAIRELAARMGAYEVEGKPFVRTFPSSGRTSQCLAQHWWYLTAARSRELLAKAGFRSRADLPGIVTRLNGVARQAMLDAMMAAEGSIERQNFFNTDAHVLEAFDILCALQGLATGRPTERHWHDGKLSSRRGPADLFNYRPCVVKKLKKTRYVHGKVIRKEDAGTADVWCPTTQYGTWVMRQNGQVMITGNTKAKIIAFDASNFDETFTEEFVGPMVQWSYPWADFPVSFVSDVDQFEPQERMTGIKTMVEMGVDVAEDEVRGVMGLSAPQPGERTVMQAMEEMQKRQQKMEMEGQQQQMQMEQAAQGGAPGAPGMDPNAGAEPEIPEVPDMPQPPGAQETPPPGQEPYMGFSRVEEDDVYGEILAEIERHERGLVSSSA